MSRRSERGQALVELALYLPFFLGFLLVCFQFAFILFAHLSVLNATRDLGRWLSVHPHTTDAQALAEIRSRLPAEVRAADLTVTFSPSCTTLTQGKCANRPVGTTLSATLTYDASSALFLPASWSLGGLRLSFPTRLAPYTLYLAVEPT